jgi:hypothetical protein
MVPDPVHFHAKDKCLQSLQEADKIVIERMWEETEIDWTGTGCINMIQR